MVYMKQIHTLHMSRSLAGIQQPDRACPSPERFLYDSFLVSFMPYLPQRNHRLARWSCLARERPLKVTDSRELPSAWLDTVDFSSNHAATFLCVLFFFVIINSSVPNRWAHGHLQYLLILSKITGHPQPQAQRTHAQGQVEWLSKGSYTYPRTGTSVTADITMLFLSFLRGVVSLSFPHTHR